MTAHFLRIEGIKKGDQRISIDDHGNESKRHVFSHTIYIRADNLMSWLSTNDIQHARESVKLVWIQQSNLLTCIQIQIWVWDFLYSNIFRNKQLLKLNKTSDIGLNS